MVTSTVTPGIQIMEPYFFSEKNLHKSDHKLCMMVVIRLTAIQKKFYIRLGFQSISRIPIGFVIFVMGQLPVADKLSW